MTQRKKQGFTILEAVIAIMIITGISVAAISSVLAARGLNEKYYGRILAYNTAENICESIEAMTLTDSAKTDGFLRELGFLYGIEAKDFHKANYATSGYYTREQEGSITRYRLYYDEAYIPISFKIKDGELLEASAEPTFYAEVSVDTSGQETVLHCSKVSTSQEETEQKDGIERQETRTTTDYVVSRVVRHNDSGEEDTAYRIDSAAESVETTVTTFADTEHQVTPKCEKRKEESKRDSTSFAGLTQNEIHTELGNCFSVSGELNGEVMSSLRVAVFHVDVCRLNGSELASSTTDICKSLGQTMAEQGAENETYAEKQRRDSVGCSLGFAGGDGSEEYPFLIGSAAQLSAMSKLSDLMAPEHNIDERVCIILDGASASVYCYGSDCRCQENAEDNSVILYRPLGPQDGDEAVTYREEEDPRIGVVSYDRSGVQVDLDCTLEQLNASVVYIPGTMAGISETVEAEGTRRDIALDDENLDGRILTAESLDAAEGLAEMMLLRGSYYFFRLTDNIDLSAALRTGDTICESFCGCFDGNGYQITAGERELTLFGSVSGNSVLKNFDLIENENAFVAIAGTAGMSSESRNAVRRISALGVEPPYDGWSWSVTVEDEEAYGLSAADSTVLEHIRIYGVGYPRDGYCPFVRNAMGRSVCFADCDNYAVLVTCAGGSSAIYVSGGWGEETNLFFENSNNYGTLYAQSSALLVSCKERTASGTSAAVGTINVLGSCNFGNIWGRKEAGYVCGVSEDFLFAELSGSYTKSVILCEVPIEETQIEAAPDGDENKTTEMIPVRAELVDTENMTPEERASLTVSAQSPAVIPAAAKITQEQENGIVLMMQENAEEAAQVKTLLVQLCGSYTDRSGQRQTLSVTQKVTPVCSEADGSIGTGLGEFRFIDGNTARTAGIDTSLLKTENTDDRSGVSYGVAEYNEISYYLFELPSGSHMNDRLDCSILMLDEGGNLIGFAE